MKKIFTYSYKASVFLLVLTFSLTACHDPIEYDEVTSGLENSSLQKDHIGGLENASEETNSTTTDSPILIQLDGKNTIEGIQKIRTPLLPSRKPTSGTRHAGNCWGKC